MISLPGAAMARLNGLLGGWRFVEKGVEDSSGSAAAKGSAAFRRGPGDLSLLFDEVTQLADETYQAHGILTWDSSGDRYRWVLADSRAAGFHVLEGRWVGGLLLFEGSKEAGADTLWRRLILEDITSASCTMTIERPPTFGGAPRLVVRRCQRDRTIPPG